MKIGRSCAYAVVAISAFMLVGCSLWTGRQDSETQYPSTPPIPPKSLAGVYRDVGRDGSIKPHLLDAPETMGPGPGDRQTGTITLGTAEDKKSRELLKDMRPGN